jgi:hypothetical protein
MENSLELLFEDLSFSEQIVVLEEFSESDSVFLDNIFDFSHQGIEFFLSFKALSLWSECAF